MCIKKARGWIKKKHCLIAATIWLIKKQIFKTMFKDELKIVSNYMFDK